ncbi:MAG: helix-turn-helix transcriptional regulator [Methanobacterium sp.]
MNAITIYDDVKNDLKLLTSSSIRTKIILSLNQDSKYLSDLKKEIGIGHSTILKEINKLETNDVVIKSNKKYLLSPIGKINAVKLSNFFKSFCSVKNIQKMLLNHYINAIPSFLVDEIGCLDNSIILESSSSDIIKPFNYYTELISSSKRIKTVFPFFYYPYLNMYLDMFNQKKDVNLILTPLIIEKAVKTIGKDNLHQFNHLDYINLFKIKEDIKIALTVTDNFLSIGLFLDDGIYDATMILINHEKEAIQWGDKLFNHFLKKSNKVSLNDLRYIKNNVF